MKLKGKVALVTGAGRGIGMAHAVRLAGLGADVVVNDIDLHSFKEFDEDIKAESVMQLVEDEGVKSLGIEANVCIEDEAKGMIDQIVSEFGKLDILINNAGGIAGKPADSFASSFSFEDLKATMDRNLMGTIYCSQAACVHMKENGFGRIVNTSSQAGLRGQAGGVYSTYGVAKAGIVAYTWYLAQELGPYNITVNCLAPGYIGSERLNRQSFNRIKDVRREMNVPLDRIGDPDDVAKVMEFFVTDLGDYVTGQTLAVCGGAVNFR